jgi:hypothetical protein
MSWEAFRWTAKSPSELYHVLGPQGVDELIRQALASCWRDLPEDARSFKRAVEEARQVHDRNLAAWRKIKQPTPEAFFADLGHTNADGHFRQAMVLCWMMMPRSGGRKVTDALKIVTQIFERNLAAWAEDEATFTGKRPTAKRIARPKAPAKKSPPKKHLKRAVRIAVKSRKKR